MKQFLFFLPLFLGLELIAQIGEQDALIMKNSDVERGTVVRREANGEILFMNVDSTFQTINQEDVFKELRVDAEMPDAKIKNLVFEPREGASFDLILEPGIAFSSDDGSSTSLVKFDFIPALAIGEQFSVGIGSGVRFPFNSGDLTIPLFADMRFSSQNRVSPIAAVGGGFLINVDNSRSSDDGYMGYTKAGVVTKNMRGGSIAFLLGVDVGEQRVSGGSPFGFGPSSNEVVISFSMSLAFTI